MFTSFCYLLSCVLAVIAVGLWLKIAYEQSRPDWVGENGSRPARW